jgi:hypothetical protein
MAVLGISLLAPSLIRERLESRNAIESETFLGFSSLLVLSYPTTLYKPLEAN